MSANLNNSLRQALRAERLRRGWTQADLAGRLGLSQPTIASWESGNRYVTPTNLRAWAALLDVPLPGGGA